MYLLNPAAGSRSRQVAPVPVQARRDHGPPPLIGGVPQRYHSCRPTLGTTLSFPQAASSLQGHGAPQRHQLCRPPFGRALGFLQSVYAPPHSLLDGRQGILLRSVLSHAQRVSSPLVPEQLPPTSCLRSHDRAETRITKALRLTATPHLRRSAASGSMPTPRAGCRALHRADPATLVVPPHGAAVPLPRPTPDSNQCAAAAPPRPRRSYPAAPARTRGSSPTAQSAARRLVPQCTATGFCRAAMLGHRAYFGGSSGVAVENIRSQGLFYRITKPCRKASLEQIDSKKGRTLLFSVIRNNQF